MRRYCEQCFQKQLKIDQLLEEVEQKVKAIDGVISLNLKLTFDPPWDQSMLSEEAKLEMGFL